MSEFESKIENNNDIANNQDFLSLAIDFLEDNNLNQIEKNELNEKILEFNLDRQSIEEQTHESIIEIKNKVELKNIIEKSRDFDKVKEQMSNLSKQEIKNIQYITWSYVDWIFWINTYLKYKNAPISEVFNPEQISKWRKVWENISLFIDNFSRLNWVDAELIAIAMSSDISHDSFVFVDEEWNITIMDKWNDNNIITFSEKVSVEWLLHESFVKRDINLITNQLNLLYRKQDRIEYINKLRNIIFEYSYQREARKIFTNQTSRWIEIIFPEANLNREMKAIDLFWDYNELIIEWEKYINDSSWEFYNQEWKRLAIYDWMILNIEELNYEIEQVPWTMPWKLYEQVQTEEYSTRPRKRHESILQESQIVQNEQINESIETNLSREFWEWLQNEWEKHIWRTWANSCWVAVYKLIDTFMRSRSIRGSFGIWYQRHWANFDSILTWEISNDNPFILQRWNNTARIDNAYELENSWINLDTIINKNLEVKTRYIDFPKDARAWEILVYNENAQSSRATNTRKIYWHVEIKWSDNNYYSYYKSNMPWWSARENQNISAQEYARLTWFNGKAYSIELKT